MGKSLDQNFVITLRSFSKIYKLEKSLNIFYLVLYMEEMLFKEYSWIRLSEWFPTAKPYNRPILYFCFLFVSSKSYLRILILIFELKVKVIIFE